MTLTMKLYRFSPIQDRDALLESIKYTHLACYKLCMQSFGKYLPNAGNMGIFCHYDDEYTKLVAIRNQLVEPSGDPNQKYFTLLAPIVIPAQDDVPETTYTHLYIRKPDIYRAQVGDVDFYLEQIEYDKIRSKLQAGKLLPGARIFPRNDLDMIELYDPDVDALAYVSTSTMSEKVRIKLSDETKL